MKQSEIDELKVGDEYTFRQGPKRRIVFVGKIIIYNQGAIQHINTGLDLATDKYQLEKKWDGQDHLDHSEGWDSELRDAVTYLLKKEKERNDNT